MQSSRYRVFDLMWDDGGQRKTNTLIDHRTHITSQRCSEGCRCRCISTMAHVENSISPPVPRPRCIVGLRHGCYAVRLRLAGGFARSVWQPLLDTGKTIQPVVRCCLPKLLLLMMTGDNRAVVLNSLILAPCTPFQTMSDL